MNPHFRVIQLNEELRRMSEDEPISSLKSFWTSIFIFDKNYHQLMELIHFLADDPRAAKLYHVRNRDQLRELMFHVIRLLHNYVASAMSLIDHTRRIYKKLYEKQKLFEDYLPRVKSQFAEDPLSQFVQDLRQYCQHYRAPNLGIVTTWHRGDSRENRTAFLEKDDLLSYSGWSRVAKQYLDRVEKHVDVAEVAMQYHKKTMEFYQWFQMRQSEIHTDELQAIRQKEVEFFAFRIQGEIEISLNSPLNDTIHRERDSIFLPVFTSQEFAELDALPIDSPERPKRAIELLQAHLPISDQLRDKIVEWYERVGSKIVSNDHQ